MKNSLLTNVAGFLSEGLIAGQPAVVIATESHRAAIVERLASRLIDVEQAKSLGDLVFLDAHELLSAVMKDETPDAEAFECHVGGLIEQTLRGRERTVLRAYGEMVDVLWKSGRTEAAIKLEILWNKLALTHSFALMCGYAMGSFYKQAHDSEEVRRQHTQIIEPETKIVPFQSKRVVQSA
jgi:hypothetical protein